MKSEEVLRLLAENEALREEITKLQSGSIIKNHQTKIGLVWEHLTEAVDRKLIEEVPILVHMPKNDITGAIPSERAHILIEGDNLHVLHTLQATHRGAIDVIYIDPPYNTGKEFIYNDKLIDSENVYRHSAWLSFMEKRLLLARDLLTDGGVLFVSIDDHEHSRLRLLMDHIFGERNCLGDLAIVNNLRGRSDSSHFAIAHESLLVYGKDSNLVSIGGFALTDLQMSEYKMTDTISKFKPETLRKRGAGARREDAPNLFYPIYWNNKTEALSLERKSAKDVEILPYFANGEESRWRWSKSKFLENHITELMVLDTKGKPTVYVKMRLESGEGDLRTAKPKTVWQDPKYDSSSGTRMIKQLIDASFNNPKPIEYITDILRISSKADSVILDFFAGSGTTLHAAAQLNAEDAGNRQCILVTNNENQIAKEVTLPRIKAVLTGKWKEGPHPALPGSLIYYQTSFMARRKSIDRMRAEIATHAVDFVAVMHGVVKRSKKSSDLTILFSDCLTIAVATSPYSDYQALRNKADESVRDGDRKIAYVFTWADQGVEDELVAIWDGWDVRPLPAQMLSALRRLAPQPTLIDEEAEVNK